MPIHRCAALLPLVMLLIGCSEPAKTEKAKEPEKPPEAVTGRHAFQTIYPMARVWKPDAKPLRLRSIILQQVKSEPGKAGAWEAIFVSQAAGRSRVYTYSAVEAEGNLHKGAFAGPEESYSGPSGQEYPFEIAAIRTDSDEAYNVAAGKSADYMKKNPDKPITFLLEQTRRFPDLAWRVIWGESASTSDYSIFVDATTGAYLEKAH